MFDVHYIDQIIWSHLTVSNRDWRSWTSFAALTVSTLIQDFGGFSVGIGANSLYTAFVRSGAADVGQEDLAHSLCSSSFERCQPGPVKFLHTKLIKPGLYSPCFEHWGTAMLEQKRAKVLP